MSEILSNNRYEDTETNFNSPEYTFDIEALKEHYDVSHEIGKNALRNIVSVESAE